MKKNQQGFTVVEGVLIIIAITLAGFVGFYVYNKNQDKKDNSITVSNQKSESSQKSEEKAKDYLTVKEAGVKFDKSAIPTAYYKLEDGYSEFPEVKIIGLYDKSYDDTTNSEGKKCGNPESANALAKIEIIPVTDRDAKYARYKASEFTVADEVPHVMSDKYSKIANGYVYRYFKYQDVQAALSCIVGISLNEDFAKVQADNKNVQDKFDTVVSKLEQMSATLQKN